MKNFKKLVLAFLVLVVAAFSFTGCSKTSTQVEMEAMEGIRERKAFESRIYSRSGLRQSSCPGCFSRRPMMIS